MADGIWTPDPATAVTGRPDCRLLVCAETSEMLYVLIEGPPPTPTPTPDDSAPRGDWLVRVGTSSGELLFKRGGSSESDRFRTVVTGWFGPPTSGVAALDVTLELDGQPAMSARAIRR